MNNPIKTIREARRQADSVLSTHEIAFAVLVENIADDVEFEKQLGFGLVAADGLAWWERSRFRYKLRQLHAKALERLGIRRAVTQQGRDAVRRMMARHLGKATTQDNGDGTYTHTLGPIDGIYISRPGNPSGKYIPLDPEPTPYLTPLNDEEWPDEIKVD